ncbi:MAG: hypothetical protein ACYDA1_00195 [Vulcanimicrobiaceae bacterium]
MISRRTLAVALVVVIALCGGRPLAAAPSLKDAISIGLFGQTVRAVSPFAVPPSSQFGLRSTRVFDGEAPTRFLRGHAGTPFALARLAFGYAVAAPPLRSMASLPLLPLLGSIAPTQLTLPEVIVPRDLGGRAHLMVLDSTAGSAYTLGFDGNVATQPAFPWSSTLIDHPAPVAMTLPFHGAQLSVHMLGQSSRTATGQNLSVGSLLNLHALRTNLHLDVQSNYQRITSLTPQSLTALPLNNPSFLTPGAVDFQQQSVGATLALPLHRGFSLGVGYGQTHLFGSYGGGTPFGLDARNNTYLGNVTYQLPHSTSAITLSAKRTFYQDNLLPTLSLPQSGNDVNLTIKF